MFHDNMLKFIGLLLFFTNLAYFNCSTQQGHNTLYVVERFQIKQAVVLDAFAEFIF